MKGIRRSLRNISRENLWTKNNKILEIKKKHFWQFYWIWDSANMPATMMKWLLWITAILSSSIRTSTTFTRRARDVWFIETSLDWHFGASQINCLEIKNSITATTYEFPSSRRLRKQKTVIRNDLWFFQILLTAVFFNFPLGVISKIKHFCIELGVVTHSQGRVGYSPTPIQSVTNVHEARDASGANFGASEDRWMNRVR